MIFNNLLIYYTLLLLGSKKVYGVKEFWTGLGVGILLAKPIEARGECPTSVEITYPSLARDLFIKPLGLVILVRVLPRGLLLVRLNLPRLGLGIYLNKSALGIGVRVNGFEVCVGGCIILFNPPAIWEIFSLIKLLT